MSANYYEELSPREIELKLRHDLEWYALNCLKIRDYDRPRAIPFQFNRAQKLIYSKMLEARAAKQPVKHIIIKARKEGVTTFYNAAMYQLASTNPFTDVILTAHDDDTSTEIFNRIRMFYDNSPEFAQPMTKASSRKEIVFENPSKDSDEKRVNPGLRSSFRVKTAGAREIQRGGTILGFHGSEVAFWGKEAHKQMLGVLNAIPDHDPRAIVALESTANGASGYFYEQVMKAYNHPEESEFDLIFLPWHMFEKYTMPLEEDEVFKLKDKHEEQLKIKGVSNEQLKWRRWAIKAKCDGDINQFRQEYPSTVDEAFIYSGRPVFDQERLYIFLQNAPEVHNTNRYIVDSERQEVVPDSNGEVFLFKQPEPGMSYYLGCDVAEGIDVSEDDTRPDPDFTWISIYDKHMRQVLSWKTKIDPDLVGPAVETLGHFYNLAWLCVENNNHGIVVCNYLKKHYPLYRQYTTIRPDYVADKITDIVGFRTTSATKGYLVAEGKKIIRDGECWVSDRRMIAEMKSFRQDSKGRYSGDGNHDDGVISFLLANVCRIYAFGKLEEKKREDSLISVKSIMKNDPALIDPFKEHKKQRRLSKMNIKVLGSFRKKR